MEIYLFKLKMSILDWTCQIDRRPVRFCRFDHRNNLLKFSTHDLGIQQFVVPHILQTFMCKVLFNFVAKDIQKWYKIDSFTCWMNPTPFRLEIGWPVYDHSKNVDVTGRNWPITGQETLHGRAQPFPWRGQGIYVIEIVVNISHVVSIIGYYWLYFCVSMISRCLSHWKFCYI